MANATKSFHFFWEPFPYFGTTTSSYNRGWILNILLMAAYQERSRIYCVVCSTELLRSPSWLSVILLTQEPKNSITKSFEYSYLYWCCCCAVDFDTGTKQASQNLLNIHWFSCCTFDLEKRAKQVFTICGLMKDISLEWMIITKCLFRKMQIWFGLMVVAVFAAGEGELCNNGWDEIHDIFCVLLFPPSPHRHLDYWDH